MAPKRRASTTGKPPAPAAAPVAAGDPWGGERFVSPFERLLRLTVGPLWLMLVTPLLVNVAALCAQSHDASWEKLLAHYQGDGDARTQQFRFPRADRGPNTGDIKSYFNAEAVYEIPGVMKEHGFARRLFSGWQLSGIFQARTGEPVTLTQTGALQINRPDYIGGQVYFNDYRTTLQYLNRSAFALVPLGAVSRASERPGNVGNGAIRTPGAVNLDFSIGKSVAITEKSKIQIRADMFNALNHTNLNGLRNSLNDTFFGQLLGTAGARIVQLNARFSF